MLDSKVSFYTVAPFKKEFLGPLLDRILYIIFYHIFVKRLIWQWDQLLLLEFKDI